MHPGIFNGPESTQATSDAYLVERPVPPTHQEDFRVLQLYLTWCVLRIGTVLGLRLMTCHENASTQVQITRTQIEKRPISLHVCLSVCLSVSLSACLSVCVCLSVSLSACLSICVSVCLNICLSVYPPAGWRELKCNVINVMLVLHLLLYLYSQVNK